MSELVYEAKGLHTHRRRLAYLRTLQARDLQGACLDRFQLQYMMPSAGAALPMTVCISGSITCRRWTRPMFCAHFSEVRVWMESENIFLHQTSCRIHLATPPTCNPGPASNLQANLRTENESRAALTCSLTTTSLQGSWLTCQSKLAGVYMSGTAEVATYYTGHTGRNSASD